MFKLKPGSETITKTFRIPVDMSDEFQLLARLIKLDNLDETATEER